MDIKDKKTWYRFLLLIIILVIIGISSYYFKIDLETISGYLEKFSLSKAALIFVIIYVFITIFIFPAKDILKVIASILFGAILSSLLIWIAEIINATVFFYLARYLGRGFVQQKIKGQMKTIDDKIEHSGFRGILILRLIPLIPYRVLDLLSGLTSISFFQYLLIVFIGSPLRIFWVQYVLAAVGMAVFKNPACLVDYMMENKIIFVWSLVYFILAIIVGFRLKFRKRI